MICQHKSQKTVFFNCCHAWSGFNLKSKFNVMPFTASMMISCHFVNGHLDLLDRIDSQIKKNNIIMHQEKHITPYQINITSKVLTDYCNFHAVAIRTLSQYLSTCSINILSFKYLKQTMLFALNKELGRTSF